LPGLKREDNGTVRTQIIKALQGPVLVIGAGGFLGANLFRMIKAVREDVYGTTHLSPSWRLEGVDERNLVYLDLLSRQSQRSLFERLHPGTVFNCSAFGAYSFEKNADFIHRTNYSSTIDLLDLCREFRTAAYISSGSSSEYGLNCKAPAESDPLMPDSHYAVSKAGASAAISYYGKVLGVPCVNLRLYSLFGPYEDSSRLMPVLCEHIIREKFPPFVAPETSHDFVYVGDAAAAFVMAAVSLKKEHYGEAYNVGSGVRTTIGELAGLCARTFDIKEPPVFNSYKNRAWDHREWYANPAKIKAAFGWEAQTSLADGLRQTVDWWRAFLAAHQFSSLSKKNLPSGKNSLSVIIACYKDGQAIPVMYERLVKTLTGLKLDYEIIFVNDASPDDSTERIREITQKDPHVFGVVHSRNFGSQAAFLSGMEAAAKEACVIMDGDLQDPPEMIEDFVREWRNGSDVVYGRRVKREMPLWLEMFYKSFYWLFAYMSEVRVPRNAGDFSLLDNKVVRCLLNCGERDYFLRGLRAYVGFRQTGVDYVRPERAFGRSTNNWVRNIGWAKKAIFAFSRAPLHCLTALGFVASALSLLFALAVVTVKILWPDSAPKGVSILQVSIMCFGSLNLLGIGLLGEYIGKIIEEAKHRPRFIRLTQIKNGNVCDWPDSEDKK
jgi:dolichol-phosphate mannosyltransferase